MKHASSGFLRLQLVLMLATATALGMNAAPSPRSLLPAPVTWALIASALIFIAAIVVELVQRRRARTE